MKKTIENSAGRGECLPVAAEEVGSFLAEYTSWLWGCGATCERTEKNVGRIAASYGYEVELTILPRHITVAVSAPGHTEPHIFTRRICPCGINFSLNASLSALSWEIADHCLSPEESIGRFRGIISRGYTDGVRVLFLTSLANASFCRLFGGDAIAMALVFVATACGYFVKQRMLRAGVDNRIVFFICAFISSAICAGGSIFGWGTTPDIALATSALYLIPGVPYINSASDLIARRYLCSFSRFMDALVLTGALSAGLWLGVEAMGAGNLW